MQRDYDYREPRCCHCGWRCVQCFNLPVRTARQLHLFQKAAVCALASAVPLVRWERIKLPRSLRRSGKVNETPVWEVSHGWSSQGDSDGGSAASTATANDGMATWRTVRPLQSSQRPVSLSDTILYIRSPPPIYLTWLEFFFNHQFSIEWQKSFHQSFNDHVRIDLAKKRAVSVHSGH